VVPDKSIAWAVTFACMLFAGRVANTFVAHNPRLYTALALFTLARAMLLPYYGVGQPSELFVAFGGFLAIYIGFLLVLEADPHRDDKNWARSTLQRAGLMLLLLVAAPTSALALPGPNGQPLFGFAPERTEKIATMILTLSGFASIIYGTYRLCGKRVGYSLACVLVAYSVLEISYACYSWNGKEMSSEYYYAFAAAKVLYTATFAGAIAYRGMTDRVRNAGYLYWICLAFGLAPTLCPEPGEAPAAIPPTS
jgi:hypothetical protein